MAMNQDQIKANLLSITFWVRLLFMAVYGVALWVVWTILIVICILQTLIVLVTGEVNDNLQRLGIHTAAYMNQIIRFMIFATEEKPFPFNPFPGDEEVMGTVVATSTAPVATQSTSTDVDAAAPEAEVVDDDDQSHDSYYDPERDSGATR